ncbi:hypothetical protein [Pacificibacter marinus]|uniref:Uncharacterized protein n=1 Tax=Pacificibacter marinus TaxID=658057 RepID=A0A1Y5T6Q0_9RHOB|nr:hypothetical protein [Pacificibacter marinus]SEL22647.1 hypothetical protein SAMN04488032_11495 [Pacificibacter marinus]SLN57030.1 hypothetical protein PAM7971_02957 [Pacificibacter marinus]
MSDILGVPAFGGGGFSNRPPLDQPEPTVPAVAALASDSSATFNKGANLPGQNGDTNTKTKQVQEESGAYAPRDPREASKARAQFDPNMLTGPTPSFQTSVLEMESDLRTVIARVEAKRAMQFDGSAIAPVPQKDETTRPSEQETEQTPTSRRDVRDTDTNVTQDTAPQPVAQFIAPQYATQTEVQDREAAYAGQAGTITTPYNRSSGFE